MARYTKIIKVFKDKDKHIYEIYNDTEKPDCYAVLNDIEKSICIYKDAELHDLIFKYMITSDNQANNKQLTRTWPDQPLFICALLNLIPAVKNNYYPDDLSRCS